MDKELLEQLNSLLEEKKEPSKTDLALESISKVLVNLEPKQGEQGIKGDKGDNGDKGEQGIQGIQGIRGEKGENGKDAILPDIKQWTEEELNVIARRNAPAHVSALASLSDVDVTRDLVDGRYLRYNAASGKWKTATTSGATSWGGIAGTLSAQTDLQAALNAKQATLVSGTNIKTVNGVTILGSGDIALPNGTSINNVSVNTVIPITDGSTIYLVDCTGGSRTITLPTPTANTGQYTIEKIDSSANPVNITGTVNGILNPTIDFQDESWTLVSNGTSYRLI